MEIVGILEDTNGDIVVNYTDTYHIDGLMSFLSNQFYKEKNEINHYEILNIDEYSSPKQVLIKKHPIYGGPHW